MSLSLGFGLITCQRYPGDPRTDTELCPGEEAALRESLILGSPDQVAAVAPRVRDLAAVRG